MKTVITKNISLMTLTLLLALASDVFALIITSPHDGDTFKEGDVVHFTAELTPETDKAVRYVRLMVYGIPRSSSCDQEIRTHPKYECDFTIPMGSPNSIKLNAHIVSTNGVIEAPEVTVNVVLPSSVVLKSLRLVGGNTVFLYGTNSLEQLHIVGHFSDGNDRNLWLRTSGTKYASSDTKIITVDDDGLVTSIANGNAQITVTNGDNKLIVNAIVKP